MNTNTSLSYLAIAMDKASSPMHPNFRRALAKKPTQLLMHNNIRLAAAHSYDANPDNVRAAIVATGRMLKADIQSYTTFFKGLAGDVAFAAHMDVGQLQRNVDEEDLDEGLDTMLADAPEITDDVPLADAINGERAAQREPYEGGDRPEPTASSVEDAYAAVKAAQAWIGLAVSNIPEEQQIYWQVDGVFPIGQRKDTLPSGEATYTPIRDFDAYREYQAAQWKAKRSLVDLPVDTEDAMLAS